MSTENLQNRLIELIKVATLEHRRFKQLEELTGIPADRWKNFWLGRQRPTAEMIEAVCQNWPEYAFWLVTGICDSEYGHCAPGEQGFPTSAPPLPNSTRFFLAAMESRREAERVGSSWGKSDNGVEAQGTILGRLRKLAENRTEDWAYDDSYLRTIYTLVHESLTEKLGEYLRINSINEQVRRAEILAQLQIPMIKPDGLRWTTGPWKNLPSSTLDQQAVLNSLLPILRALLQHSSQNAAASKQILAVSELEDKIKAKVSEIDGNRCDFPR
jgi:hypothetical protein